jgi:hypothetical protein
MASFGVGVDIGTISAIAIRRKVVIKISDVPPDFAYSGVRGKKI